MNIWHHQRVISIYWCWAFTYMITYFSYSFSFKNKLAPLYVLQKSRAPMLLFLLHIAPLCQLFLSNKATMATGSICLPVCNLELPISSWGLACSYMWTPLKATVQGIFKAKANILKKRDLVSNVDQHKRHLELHIVVTFSWLLKLM